tara:strand:- start:3821 stop:6589 length:2769 start_codon:yes stop_codon:yes gene_type:complete
MYKINRMASALTALAAVAAVALPVAPVYAADDEEEMEQIVVTGSRIKRDNFSSSSPITVISGQSLVDSGMTNLGEALRNQPSIGTGGFNQSSVLSGGGSTSIDLRNLGPDRVLILINGRRVASFADALANQAADLTFIPTAMVERVEILRDGASAVYGSDAITGVVNVILKKDFEGAEITAGMGSTSEGDGDTTNVSMTVGTVGDRGSAVFGAEIRDQEPIKQVDRDWAFPSVSSLTATSFQNGSFFSPGGVFLGDTDAVFCTRAKALGGDEITDVSNGDGSGCESFAPRQTGEPQLVRYDYGLAQDLIIDSKTISASGFMNYELTDNVNVFMEMQYSKRESTSHLDGNPGSFGTVAYPAGSRVPASNPNNPTGEDGSFYFRPSSTIGPRTSEHESNTIRFVTGVEGSIPENLWFNDAWSYEASFLYTKVDADLRTNSTWNLARFIRISDPAQCSVDDLCSQTVNASGALDTFRPGNWTQEEISYMRQNTLAISKFSTHGWQAVISGPLFELPAGEVAMAAGLEYRKERGLNVPDPTTQAGESVANQVFVTEGAYDVEEFFLEFDVPLLADVFLAQELTLNLQYRRSDYSTFGSDDVYRVGVNWQIIDSVRLRANVSTAYRAPSITDLFGGGTVSFDFVDDPCQGASDANTIANCALDGLGAGFTQVTAQYPVLAGSNASLEPETADTWTAGVIFTPGFLPGLEMSIDVWDIEVENLITTVTSTSVLEDCYGGPVGKTDPKCAQFNGRGNQGVPRNFVNRLQNSADGVETDGFDMAVNYGFDAFMDTTWNLELVGTYVAENTFYPGAGGADDGGSTPRVVANFNTNVDWNNFGFAWYMRYVSAMNDPRYDGDNAFGYSGTDDYYKHDLRASYDWDNYRVLLGVNNVTDEDPEYVFSSGNNTDTNLYDVRGAYYFVRFEAQLL